jgi:hypothetical protein
MSASRQVVKLLSGEAFHFRGAKIRNRTGKPVRLEVETEAYEIRKIRTEEHTAREDDGAANLADVPALPRCGEPRPPGCDGDSVDSNVVPQPRRGEILKPGS